MPEPENNNIEEEKKVAYYSALLSAWIQTKMERDKTLISLSAIGVGFLITILSSIGVKHWWEILLYCAASLFFIATIVVCTIIFDRNSKHIEDVLNKKASQDYVLARLDRLSCCFFILAVGFSLAIGTITAINKLDRSNVSIKPESSKGLNKSLVFKKGDQQMSDMEKTRKTKKKIITENLNGISNLNPDLNNKDTRSLNGIANIAPKPEATSNQTNSEESASTSSDSQVQANDANSD